MLTLDADETLNAMEDSLKPGVSSAHLLILGVTQIEADYSQGMGRTNS